MEKFTFADWAQGHNDNYTACCQKNFNISKNDSKLQKSNTLGSRYRAGALAR